MRHFRFFIIAAVILATAEPGQAATIRGVEVSPYFSPHYGCTTALVEELGKAKSNILIQARTLSNVKIAKALLDARKRGVAIMAIVDRSQTGTGEDGKGYSPAQFLKEAGAQVFIEINPEGIQHSNVMVIDSITVITGSFDFTTAAEEKNRDNLVVMRSKELAGWYESNWRTVRSQSRDYTGEEKKPDPKAKP